jgi:hypothetical protein
MADLADFEDAGEPVRRQCLLLVGEAAEVLLVGIHQRRSSSAE